MLFVLLIVIFLVVIGAGNALAFVAYFIFGQTSMDPIYVVVILGKFLQCRAGFLIEKRNCYVGCTTYCLAIDICVGGSK